MRDTEIREAMKRHPAGRSLERLLPDIVVCPEPGCPAPAQVVQRWSQGSTDGTVEFVKTRCFEGHVFTPVAETVRAFLVRPREVQNTAA